MSTPKKKYYDYISVGKRTKKVLQRAKRKAEIKSKWVPTEEKSEILDK